MLVLTVQSYRNIQKIYNESYIPDLRKSRYAYLSTRYLRGYMYNIESLSKKTGIGYRYGLDSCMWGWGKKPDIYHSIIIVEIFLLKIECMRYFLN